MYSGISPFNKTSVQLIVLEKKITLAILKVASSSCLVPKRLTKKRKQQIKLDKLYRIKYNTRSAKNFLTKNASNRVAISIFDTIKINKWRKREEYLSGRLAEP